MGFFRGVGKAFSSVGKAGIGAGKAIGSTGMAGGSSLLRRGAKIARDNPTRLVAATAAAAGTGALLAELDGQASVEKTALGAGAAGFGVASLSATAGSAMALGGTGALSAGAMAAGATYSLGKASVKGPANLGFDNMNQLKLSKTGLALVGGSALYEGAIKAKDAFYRSRTGTHDGVVRSSTPVVPLEMPQQSSYVNNAGATGDLVFALNNLRNGR